MVNISDFITFGITPEQRKVVYMVAWRSALVFHIAWACGFLMFIGLDGFAWSNEVKDIKQETVIIQTELLEQRIFDTRIRQCATTSGEARQFYTEKMQELLRKYVELTRRQYPLPLCDEVR